MVGLGVASFGHVNGVHMQNLDTWETYSAAVARGEHSAQPRLPADRRGAADSRARAAAQAGLDPAGVFQDKYGVNVLERFREPLASLAAEGYCGGRATTSSR